MAHEAVAGAHGRIRMTSPSKATAAAQPERCPWHGIADPVYTRYHDEEWGVPHANSTRLFEKLCLESFQSGLSWLTILKKRDAFRKAFRDFDAEKIARFGAKDIERLMGDAGIVRNRAKIEATIGNAKAYLAVSKREPFAAFLWNFVDGKPAINRLKQLSDAPAQTDLSLRMSKALKAEGFNFVGPTTVYAFLQSSGFVNDHLVSCHRHAACADLMRRFDVERALT
jgi:DNA-3-methyladenine glycosylase I